MFGPNVEYRRTDDSKRGGGTCAASKVAGRVNGISKDPHLIAVKTNLDTIGIVWVFSAIVNDIIGQGYRGRAVIVSPLASTKRYRVQDLDLLPPSWKMIGDDLLNLKELGAVVITGAGNAASPSEEHDTLPALFTQSLDKHKHYPIIVAGAVDLDGKRSSFSQSTSEVVWAPGRDVVCASSTDQKSTVKISGTLASVAMVCYTTFRYMQ